MVADEPVTPQILGELLEMSPSQIELVCEEIRESYESEERGFILVRVAGGYRFQSHPDLVGYVEKFVLDGKHTLLKKITNVGQ